MIAGQLHLIIKEKLVILIYSQLFTSSVLSITYIFFFTLRFTRIFFLLNFRSFDFWSHSFCCFYFWSNQLLGLVQVYSLYGKCRGGLSPPCSLSSLLSSAFFICMAERETFLSMQSVHLNKVREWMDQNVITKLARPITQTTFGVIMTSLKIRKIFVFFFFFCFLCLKISRQDYYIGVNFY